MEKHLGVYLLLTACYRRFLVSVSLPGKRDHLWCCEDFIEPELTRRDEMMGDFFVGYRPHVWSCGELGRRYGTGEVSCIPSTTSL